MNLSLKTHLLAMLILLGCCGVACAQEDGIAFAGVKELKEADLKAALVAQFDELSAENFTPSIADDMEWVLATYYRKQGFLQATVETGVHSGHLHINVNEGVQTTVRSVTFKGNKSIPDATLYEFMIGADPEKLLTLNLPYNPGGIEEGVERVRGLYGSKGWLDAAFEHITKMNEGGRFADITVNIQEGIQYTFGSIRFTGNLIFEQEMLLKEAGITSGTEFTPLAAETAQQALQGFYKAKGYFMANVTVTADKTTAVNGKVPVVFFCEPGNLHRIGSIVSHGTEKLSPDFLPKRFRHLSGEIYDQEKIDETGREMMRTGLFSNFRVTTVPEDGDTLRLEIQAKENKSREFGMELGYGTYDGATIGLKWGNRNLAGTGRPLTIGLEYTQRGFRGEVLYRDPWWLDGDWNMRARLYSDLREEDGYDRAGIGGRVDFMRKLTTHWEGGFYLVQEYASLSNTLIDPLLIGPTDYALTAIGISQTFDFRNDSWNPKDGWIVTSALDLNALDGEFEFVRATLRYTRYWSLGKTLLSAGGRVGMIFPSGEDEGIPIDLRYFNGGGNTVRSYAERDLGPRDSNGYSLGGNFYTVFNLEWNFPISGALDGAIFADAGNLQTDSSPSFDNMGYAVGIGIRYKLPIGPLRVDYGFNPSPGEDDAIGAFHIGFGVAF